MADSKSVKVGDKPVSLVMPSYGVVNYPRLKSLLTSLAKQMGFRLSVDGADLMERTSDGGVHMQLSGGSSNTITFPWQCTVVAGVLRCSGGSYKTTAIPATDIGTGSGWAYLKATWNVSDVEDGFLLSATLTSVTFNVGGSVPSDVPGSGFFYIPIVQFAGNKVIGQHRTAMIDGRVCDDETGRGLGIHSG